MMATIFSQLITVSQLLHGLHGDKVSAGSYCCLHHYNFPGPTPAYNVLSHSVLNGPPDNHLGHFVSCPEPFIVDTDHRDYSGDVLNELLVSRVQALQVL